MMLVKSRTASLGQSIDDLAIAALTAELICYPKPGLVSFRDCGSHADMDATTFLVSIRSLSGYFRDMADAGSGGASFSMLNRIGRQAEFEMLRATNGVNTHRGAVFSLGVLAAATGYTLARGGRAVPEEICLRVGSIWGSEIIGSNYQCRGTHGASVRERYGVLGAREHASIGFPTLRYHSIPAFRSGTQAGLNANWSGVHSFLSSVAVLDDNNLLHRGGADALSFAQQGAKEALAKGGALTFEGRRAACILHEQFVAAWLSPGGSADMLASCYFLMDIEKTFGV